MVEFSNSGLLGLLWQSVLGDDVEVAGRRWRSGVRLSSPDTDGVIALSDDRIAIVSDHAEVARVEVKVHLLISAGIQVDPLKTA
jgi:hypothetical protein